MDQRHQTPTHHLLVIAIVSVCWSRSKVSQQQLLQLHAAERLFPLSALDFNLQQDRAGATVDAIDAVLWWVVNYVLYTRN